MVNNWMLSLERISPNLKLSDKTFQKNFIKKNKHKNVNLWDKKSQTSEKKSQNCKFMW